MWPPHLDLAVLVGAAPLPGDGPERPLGQPQHRGLVLDEQLALRLAFEVVVLLGERHAHGRQLRVQRLHRPYLRHGDEQVRPHRPHLRLHVALLVARGGVAEPVVEAVVRRAGGEQVGGVHLAAYASPDAGGVVEHDQGEHAAQELEAGGQSLADALGRLAAEHLRDADVGVGER